MINRITAFLVILLTLASISIAGTKKLVINPKLEGGLGTLTVFDSKIVKIDSISKETPTNKPAYYNYKEMYPEGTKPYAILITGRVPDVSKRWVVAMTKDQAEFKAAFPKYKKLMTAGKRGEASRALHIATSMAVTTRAERRTSDGKATDHPAGVGEFFFEMDLLAFRNHGGYLTFLCFEPKPGDDIVDFGHGIEDGVRGELLVEEWKNDDEKLVDYRMHILKADVRKDFRPNKLTIIKTE